MDHFDAKYFHGLFNSSKMDMYFQSPSGLLPISAVCVLVISLGAFHRLVQGKELDSKLALSLALGDATHNAVSFITCWHFNSANHTQHGFSSLRYPYNYPNNTDCTEVLEAPEGHRIKLDFRESFHIEKSDDCEYDFLEIRDGPFGYSPSKGKYCGQNHPPMIESTSRYLWIRFKSDNSIEYKGFLAVYEFVQTKDTDGHEHKPNSVCKIDVDMSQPETRLTSSQVLKAVAKNATSYECTFALDGDTNTRVFIDWEQYTMEAGTCTKNFIEIYERTTARVGLVKQMCGAIAKPYRSNHNRVFVRVYAMNNEFVPRFDALVTVFQQGPCDALEGSSWFDCEGDDVSCIDASLVCNGRTNCNYKWDESNCNIAGKPGGSGKPLMSWKHAIILSIVGMLLLTVICLSFIFTVRQHHSEAQRRKTALHSQERHSVDTEMHTLLNGSPRGGHLRSGAATPGLIRHSRTNGSLRGGAAEGTSGGGIGNNHVRADNPHIRRARSKSPQHKQLYDDAQYADMYNSQGNTRKPVLSDPMQRKYPATRGANHVDANDGYDVVASNRAAHYSPNRRPDLVQEAFNTRYASERSYGLNKSSDIFDRPNMQSNMQPLLPNISIISNKPSSRDDYMDISRPGNTSYFYEPIHAAPTHVTSSHNKQNQPYARTKHELRNQTGKHAPPPYRTLPPVRRQSSLDNCIDSELSSVHEIDTSQRPKSTYDIAGVSPKQRHDLHKRFVAQKSSSVDDTLKRPQRALSMDTKKAPILPDFRTTAQASKPSNASPDMYYTRPRKTDVRHAVV